VEGGYFSCNPRCLADSNKSPSYPV